MKLNNMKKKFPEIDSKIKKFIIIFTKSTAPDVPVGEDEQSNKIIKKVGDIPANNFKPRPILNLVKN